MIVWPDIARHLAAPRDAGPGENPGETVGADTPEVRPARPGPSADAGPKLPPPGAPVAAARRRTASLSAGVILALAVSAAAHAALIVFLTERLMREGVEAAPPDAVSVEIIFEAPPEAEPAKPAEGSDTQSPATEAEAPVEEMKPAESAAAGDAGTEPAEPADESERAETGPTAVGQAEPTAAISSVTLPTEDVPTPTPRPRPPVAREAPATAAARASAGTGKTRPAPKPAMAAKPEPRKPAAESRTAPARKAGRKGGATAGEKAAYARRLAAHVERHKRYPRAAQRQGLSGAASLAITIDRNGRLAAARLNKRSGHAILDEEALAVARRAAPYPRPPEGVGASTISFTVTLRFSR